MSQLAPCFVKRSMMGHQPNIAPKTSAPHRKPIPASSHQNGSTSWDTLGERLEHEPGSVRDVSTQPQHQHVCTFAPHHKLGTIGGCSGNLNCQSLPCGAHIQQRRFRLHHSHLQPGSTRPSRGMCA